MILNLKIISFILLIFFGYYIFLLEYEKLTNFEINYQKQNFKKEELLNSDLNKTSKKKEGKKIITEEIVNNDFKIVKIKVKKGDTFFSIIKSFEIEDQKVFEIIEKIKNYYNPKKLKINDTLVFYYNEKNKLQKLEINLDIDELLVVNIGSIISIEKIKLEKIKYEISHEFNIKQSLYADGLKNNVPQNILIKLIKLFSFDLDFQRDIKKDTLVSVSYELNQVKKNKNIIYQDINYALISIEDKKLEYFKFTTDDGYTDYFNREGKNVKKSILKTPIDGARLSSSFGMRKHPILGYNKMHKGVDFAAPTGTPVYAGGNGVIEFIGNNGGYGKYIRIRHNNEYKTAYAHLSSYNKGMSKGVRVNQGDVIGYVGSTGRSTGPHLHYEIIFQNEQINPLKLKLPSGKVLAGQELERFRKEYKEIYANHLNQLYE